MDPKLHLFFEPSSIAVIGASRRENSPGYVVFRNLIENHRRGVLKAEVYGVNIKGGEIFGEKLYRSITDIPSDVDHAVIVIPAKFVPKSMEECGRKGVKVATILSAGFSEIGNVELEEEVRETAKRYGIRIIGPNGLGIYDPYSGVDTLFIPERKSIGGKEIINLARPDKGFIAFLTQSGALGGALLDYLAGEHLGVSKFVSWGNKIDVEESEMLLYLLQDERTRVITIYIEALKGNARKLVRIGREVTKRKPVVILKGGVTEAGARATLSHTASLAGRTEIYYSAFKTMGAVVADGVLDMLDKAKALALQPPARGRNVGIVTNGGGPGIIVADIAEERGLRVPKLSQESLDELRRYVRDGTIPEIATFANPIDISGTATDDAYAVATEVVLADRNIDLVIVLALHHPPTLTDKMPERILSVIRDYKKPVIIMDIGLLGLSREVKEFFDRNSIPAFSLPERVVSGACGLVEYGEWLKRNGILEEYLESWRPPEAPV